MDEQTPALDPGKLNSELGNAAYSCATSDPINISDVIEVIETDCHLTEIAKGNHHSPLAVDMPRQSVSEMAVDKDPPRISPYVEIVEQPAPKALRFRYECEGRSAGSIPGASSTPDNKTFPTIRVVGFKGHAVVVVSCVTKDAPYRAHPHNLVGREGCKRGVCTMHFSPDTMTCTFSNLGIQCVKRKDVDHALSVREEIKVDPFLNGFSHRAEPTTIDLNAVRLCFQVFLQKDQASKFTTALPPVVSEPIFDKKAMSDLLIIKLSDDQSFVDGGHKDIILLCEKVAKEDIQIRFFEDRNLDGCVTWEAFADFQPSQVHKQTAIWFRAPRYHRLDITEPAKVWIQLRRPSDGATSEALPFLMLPLDSDSGSVKYSRRKRKKIHESNEQMINDFVELNHIQGQYMLNMPMDQNTIKMEPHSPYHDPYLYMNSTTPNYVTDNGCPSPNMYAATGGGPMAEPQQPSASTSCWPSPGLLHNLAATPLWQQQQSPQTTPSAAHIPTGNLLNLDEQPILSRPMLPQQQLNSAAAIDDDLKPININSGDLGSVSFSDSTCNLSESFNHSLSLVDLTTMSTANQPETSNMVDGLLPNSMVDFL